MAEATLILTTQRTCARRPKCKSLTPVSDGEVGGRGGLDRCLSLSVGVAGFLIHGFFSHQAALGALVISFNQSLILMIVFRFNVSVLSV